jgi:hypothetical protein
MMEIRIAGMGSFCTFAPDLYDGIRLVQRVLEERFVRVIDDWNWQHMKMGMFKALSDENIRCEYSAVAGTKNDNTRPACSEKDGDWHKGHLTCVCRKTG